jgi:hypothetical protein
MDNLKISHILEKVKKTHFIAIRRLSRTFAALEKLAKGQWQNY